MGLTNHSTGKQILYSSLQIQKKTENDCVIALAGNPNVGKSTVFNGLTGMNQHTGNWPGKTVANAQGTCQTNSHTYVFVDLPGTYSLMSHSAEEEIARNFICFSKPDAVTVVCDATCLERNLNLVLQIIETGKKVILAINLLDEAKRKNITINVNRLSQILHVPVIGMVARKKKDLKHFLHTLDEVIEQPYIQQTQLQYPDELEQVLTILEQNEDIKALSASLHLSIRWISLRLLDPDESFINEMNVNAEVLSYVKRQLLSLHIDTDSLKDMIVTTLINEAEKIGNEVISIKDYSYQQKERFLDRILTSKLTGYPIMIALFAFIFFITITGANYPSSLISNYLFFIQQKLSDFFVLMNAPEWLHGILVLGIYRVLAWVVSVMLPPMAIFFPLFTLLEDIGYLPRIAYNLDKPFARCRTCGKQALTMCMGFGCNAAGIVGCRIIDSPRERLLAILTNNFVPCNGRFPTLIAILTMFFIGSEGSFFSSLLSACLLTLLIIVGIFMTFGVTYLLSKTILKGIPSFFTLELPPFRKPQVGKIVVRSIFDRTLFVLARAVIVAIPAGMIIWLCANIMIGNVSLLSHCASFLDPLGRLMGLDGVILIAFILGFPANEIVIPIIIMAYMSQGSILELGNLSEMKQLFITNGWTYTTALCTMLFSLMHWPCSTTLLTIKKETAGIRWMFLAAVIPTLIGMGLCIIVAAISRL